MSSKIKHLWLISISTYESAEESTESTAHAQRTHWNSSAHTASDRRIQTNTKYVHSFDSSSLSPSLDKYKCFIRHFSTSFIHWSFEKSLTLFKKVQHWNNIVQCRLLPHLLIIPESIPFLMNFNLKIFVLHKFRDHVFFLLLINDVFFEKTPTLKMVHLT